MTKMKTILLLACLSSVSASFAERQPFDRYQSIVDRQMFGQPPPGFDPSKPASEVAASSRAEEKALTQEQEKLQSSIQFSVINITPEGETAVGFSDNSDPKMPKHYYLKVGEERDGWLVKEANPAEASMTIAKGEIEVSLKIGENSAKGGATAKADGAANAGAAPSRFGGGLRSRRMARLAEQRQLAAADAKRAEEAKADQEAKEAQREAQRQAEREEQRSQLMAIQEELKRAREESRQKQQQQESEENAGNDGQ